MYRLPIWLATVLIALVCEVMVRVRVEVRVKNKAFVSVQVRDQKQILRDCALASELIQANFHRGGFIYYD